MLYKYTSNLFNMTLILLQLMDYSNVLFEFYDSKLLLLCFSVLDEITYFNCEK